MTKFTRALALTLALLTASLGMGATALPAAAHVGQQDRACTAPGGWQFRSSIYIQDAGSGWAFHNKSIGYLKPGWLGLEWRYRVVTSGGTVLVDTGYQTDPNINTWNNWNVETVSKAWGAMDVWMDAGRLGDGLPTCRMTVAVG